MSLKTSSSSVLKKLGLGLSGAADKLHVSERNRLKKEFAERDAREMLKTSFPLDRSSIAIDVGGYMGDWASDIYSRYRCRVIVLEPVPTFCDHLRQRFEKNLDIKIIQAGLGAHTREENISLQADGTSFIRASNIKQTVKMLSAAELFANEKLENVDLMKINIEGSEYELLRHLVDAKLITRVRNVLVQFHDLSAESVDRMRELRAALSATHKPLFQYDFVWEAWTLK